jgi:hypothetical protein
MALSHLLKALALVHAKVLMDGNGGAWKKDLPCCSFTWMMLTALSVVELSSAVFAMVFWFRLKQGKSGRCHVKKRCGALSLCDIYSQ